MAHKSNYMAVDNTLLSADSLKQIVVIDQILRQYTGQGYTLTVRQLYYQLVARDHIPNNMRSYKRIVDLVGKGRKAGLLDWNAIEDRGRNMRQRGMWDSPKDILHAAANSFALNPWDSQDRYPVVLIEKDALVGVVEPICQQFRVPYMANKGYSSLSEIYSLATRLLSVITSGREPIIFYLGDHDPSGIDMDRDIVDRLAMFDCLVELERLALTSEQIAQYDPPENPTKLTDSRANGYIEQWGYSSWELDALTPDVLQDLVREAIEGAIEWGGWTDVMNIEEQQRKQIKKYAQDFQGDD